MGWHVGAPAVLLAMRCGRSVNARNSYRLLTHVEVTSPRSPLCKLSIEEPESVTAGRLLRVQVNRGYTHSYFCRSAFASSRQVRVLGTRSVPAARGTAMDDEASWRRLGAQVLWYRRDNLASNLKLFAVSQLVRNRTRASASCTYAGTTLHPSSPRALTPSLYACAAAVEWHVRRGAALASLRWLRSALCMRRAGRPCCGTHLQSAAAVPGAPLTPRPPGAHSTLTAVHPRLYTSRSVGDLHVARHL